MLGHPPVNGCFERACGRLIGVCQASLRRACRCHRCRWAYSYRERFLRAPAEASRRGAEPAVAGATVRAKAKAKTKAKARAKAQAKAKAKAKAKPKARAKVKAKGKAAGKAHAAAKATKHKARARPEPWTTSADAGSEPDARGDRNEYKPEEPANAEEGARQQRAYRAGAFRAGTEAVHDVDRDHIADPEGGLRWTGGLLS